MRFRSGARELGHNSGHAKSYPSGNVGKLCRYFLARKGLVIHKALEEIAHDAGFDIPDNARSRVLASLTDFYGLDIRNLGYRRWVLAGEWFGIEYKDYIAERINNAQTP